MHQPQASEDAREQLTAAVLVELRDLRGARGRLTIGKFSQYQTLVRVCGENDLLDAFLMFRRELQRYATSTRDEAAAAWSILGDAESVTDRLYIALDHLDPAAERDQRTARRWGDKALPGLAAELVLLGETRGRLGVELLNLELHGDLERGLHLVIDQMTRTELGARAPEVSLWRYTPDGAPIEVGLALEKHGSTEVVHDDYTMRRHRLAIQVPDWFSGGFLQPSGEDADDRKLLGVTITGHDAPGRAVTFTQYAELGDSLVANCVVQRQIVEIGLLLPVGSALPASRDT